MISALTTETFLIIEPLSTKPNKPAVCPPEAVLGLFIKRLVILYPAPL